MTETRLWDRAAALPARTDGTRLPEVVALDAGLPTLDELFDFMRDAELRFATLRLRIEERAWTSRGEEITLMDTVVRHPGDAKVTTTRPGDGDIHGLTGQLRPLVVAGRIPDGQQVRSHSGHRLGEGPRQGLRHHHRGVAAYPRKMALG